MQGAGVRCQSHGLPFAPDSVHHAKAAALNLYQPRPGHVIILPWPLARIMNDNPPSHSASHNMSTSQTQTTEGTAIGEFFDNDLQSYANYQQGAEAPQEEFMWDPNLFTNPQIYSPHVANQTPAWSQNATAQSQDPPLTGYGGLQSSFQLSQYGQPAFDHPQPSSQPAHDPRLMARPSPSPSHYNDLNHHAATGYKALSYPNQQQFDPQSMVYPQRPSSTSTQNYDGHANQSPYFNYSPHVGGLAQLQVGHVFIGTFWMLTIVREWIILISVVSLRSSSSSNSSSKGPLLLSLTHPFSPPMDCNNRDPNLLNVSNNILHLENLPDHIDYRYLPLSSSGKCSSSASRYV